MSTASPVPDSTSIQAARPRLMSIDVVRGIDMFLLIASAGLVDALRKISGGGTVKFVADQFEHKPWAGFHFEDLGLPMFIFIVGVSIVFATARALERSGRGAVARRIV